LNFELVFVLTVTYAQLLRVYPFAHRGSTMRKSLAFLLALFALSAHAADKLKVEDVLAQHLASIGTPEARAAAKTRLLTGNVEMQEVVGGSSVQRGTVSFACDDRRIKVDMKFPGSVLYPFGEQWLFDGKQAQVAFTASGTRSVLGAVLYHYSDALREGLLGGSMCTSWSLLDAKVRNARLKYTGLKKIAGRDLHEVTYSPRGGSGSEIRLFFEPETFRHVKTKYLMVVPAGATDTWTSHTEDTRYMIDEDFSGFKTADGLSLPSLWTIHVEVQPNKTSVLEWRMAIDKLQNNAEL
jgi:hypothetical protein